MYEDKDVGKLYLLLIGLHYSVNRKFQKQIT